MLSRRAASLPSFSPIQHTCAHTHSHVSYFHAPRAIQEDTLALSFVRECVGMFSVHARGKNITLVSDYSGAPPPAPAAAGGAEVAPGAGLRRALVEADVVSLDKFKISQVLRNLVSNALKVGALAAPGNGRRPQPSLCIAHIQAHQLHLPRPSGARVGL